MARTNVRQNLARQLKRVDDGLEGTLSSLYDIGLTYVQERRVIALMRLSYERGRLVLELEQDRFANGLEEELNA